MRRLKDKNEDVANIANFRTAFGQFSKGKQNRKRIQNFMKDLDDNLEVLMEEYAYETWESGGYRAKTIHEKKERVLGKAPIKDHVIEAAVILPYEKDLYDYLYWRCPAVRPGMGTNALLRMIRNDLFNHSQKEMYYFLSMDAHHYFPRMDHQILKDKLQKKIKPGKLLRFLFKVIDSYPQGVPLGIKVAQIFGQLYLAEFDRKVVGFFNVYKDKEKLKYWCSRYVEHKIITARTKDDFKELCKGVEYLSAMFYDYAKEGVRYYSRFVDNMIIIHPDKSFLYVLKEIMIMILERDYHVTMNKDYAVNPTYTGIRIAGYVFYHDRVLLSKSNKQNLARHVMSLWKQGFSEEDIRIKQASRFGFAKHANTTHLIKSLGMEKTLGKIIRRRRGMVPFQGMNIEQKLPFSKVVTKIGEERKKILLIDTKIQASKIQKKDVRIMLPNSGGELDSMEQQEADKCLAIRFKRILKVETFGGEETYVCEKKKDANGYPMKEDAEFYSFTGSKVLIDQAEQDFTIEDLPCPTVIQEQEKHGKKFYKFE